MNGLPKSTRIFFLNIKNFGFSKKNVGCTEKLSVRPKIPVFRLMLLVFERNQFGRTTKMSFVLTKNNGTTEKYRFFISVWLEN